LIMLLAMLLPALGRAQTPLQREVDQELGAK
jgi:hypothetical protein